MLLIGRSLKQTVYAILALDRRIGSMKMAFCAKVAQIAGIDYLIELSK
jgi:hypothetical protein